MPIDYTKYPSNWKTEIVPRILKRAENKCELCGLENKSTVYALKFQMQTRNKRRYGMRTIWFRDVRDAQRVDYIAKGPVKPVTVILTVAHLDHDEENHNVKDDRLMAMCQYCHLRYDAEEKFQRKVRGQNEPRNIT